jgi:DNA-binding PadR family transcriptional regulator
MDRLAQRRLLLPAAILLLLAEEPGHGYQLVERLRPFGFELKGPGAVYRELRALEETGLARSSWSAPRTGPIPRVYELTPAGHRALDLAAEDAQGIERLVQSFRDRYRVVVGGRPPGRRTRRAPAVALAAAAEG